MKSWSNKIAFVVAKSSWNIRTQNYLFFNLVYTFQIYIIFLAVNFWSFWGHTVIRGNDYETKSFRQYSWNSEVETIWIRLIGWPLRTSTADPKCTTAVCFQIAENELMITQLSSKLKRQTGQSQFFTKKKTEKQIGRLMDSFIEFVTYSTLLVT